MKLLAAPSFRRFLAMTLTAGVVVLNTKTGLNLPSDQLAMIVAGAIIYILQSSIRQGKAPSVGEVVKAVQDAMAGGTTGVDEAALVKAATALLKR